ncbi:hypothetical protein [Paraburkholderia acidisoli]|uniref:Lipoprotein n=1 Tax=Paraburkholderia acidisoli TaxID=2571748 RepID=A0A7Z2JIH4_9BURK|nr:hypothetical protein [Paraburkholderia acidisoli]QGZ64359.1 hypothetical protein FAZ98_21810 [Paraburkholderia acidisoli]
MRILLLLWGISAGGCTLVTIEGNDNMVSDTGGHGGVVLAPQPRQQGVALPLHRLDDQP